jgi:hypothetical protein
MHAAERKPESGAVGEPFEEQGKKWCCNKNNERHTLWKSWLVVVREYALDHLESKGLVEVLELYEARKYVAIFLYDLVDN